MKPLEKYSLLPRKWQQTAYRTFFSAVALPYFPLLFGLLFFFCQPGFTQNYYGHQFVKEGQSTRKAYEKAGAKAFKRENYAGAMEHYQNALKIDSLKIENHYKLGLAARAFDANLEAKKAFATVKMLNDPLEPFPNYADAIFYYSVIEKELGNEDNAMVLKEELDSTYTIPSYKFTKINNIEEWNQIENICYDEIGDAASKIIVTHLDSTVNTIYSEVNPFWRNGKLHYASLRFQKEDDKYSPARLYAKTLQGRLGEEGTTWRDMNIANKTTAHFTFDPNENLMYFTICDYTKGKTSTLQCELYYKVKMERGWSEPRKLSNKINQTGYTTTHPAIGFNETGEKVLFYASDRLGGKGGLDIWYAPILAPNKFGKPKSLSINTSKNDITPFYHHPTNTLYFSSQGNKKVKQYDIYKIANNGTGSWSSIESLPYPINSEADDFGYFLTPDGNRGFMASSRADCNQLESGEWACHDIFQIDTKIRQPVLHVQLFDGKTKAKLDRGIITLLGGEKEEVQENLYGNDFYFSGVSSALTYSLLADRKGYRSKRVECPTIPPFDTLVVPVYLNRDCEEAITTIQLFDASNGTPLNNGVVTIMKEDLTTPQVGSQNGNEFIFTNIYMESTYQIDVVANRFYGQKIAQVLTPCDTIKIQLVPVPIPPPIDNPDYDTIACYFDHDRPRRAGDKSYNDLYIQYLTRFGRYQERFARVYNKGGFDTTVCGQSTNNILEDSVTTFFCDKVDFSFKILTSFKNDLLIELARLDKNGDPYIINIKGYASPVGDTDYNISLADRRIESLKQYFLSIPELNKYFFNKNDDGDANPLLTFEKLPFGEDRIPPIFENEKDYRNTIYNPHSAIKRRVEIIRRSPESSNLQNSSKE